MTETDSDGQMLEDCQALSAALGRVRGAAGFTQDEFDIAAGWAAETAVNSAVLGLVRRGVIGLDVCDGELCFVGEKGWATAV